MSHESRRAPKCREPRSADLACHDVCGHFHPHVRHVALPEVHGGSCPGIQRKRQCKHAAVAAIELARNVLRKPTDTELYYNIRVADIEQHSRMLSHTHAAIGSEAKHMSMPIFPLACWLG